MEKHEHDEQRAQAWLEAHQEGCGKPSFSFKTLSRSARNCGTAGPSWPLLSLPGHG
jgi:hypothetical protein